MTRQTKIILTSVLVLALVAAAVAVKMIFFPSARDIYFQPNPNRLRQVPPGFAVVRPTHFPGSPQRPSAENGMVSANVQGARWMVGRNVTLPMLFSVAYGYNPGRIALPPDAPKGNFDFLVTVPKDPEARLQAAIRRKLGYVAQRETRESDVLALKIKNGALPGLTVNTTGQGNISQKSGRLYFTHMPMNVVAGGLESMLQTPVVDQTGLTNFYDFSVAWDFKTQRQMQDRKTARATAETIIKGWGLGLEPDTASIEMLVVKRPK